MHSPYPHLLAPIKIGKFILKNRMQSSNSLPHFSQGPERYPADPTLNHFVGRARTGAAFITFAGMDDNINMPPFPDTLDMPHFPDFDIHDAQCQNYIIEMIEGMHAVNSIVSGSLFSATRNFYYENENGEVELVSGACARSNGPTAMGDAGIDDSLSVETLTKIAKSYGQQTAIYKRLGFDAVTIHMSYRAQLPGQLLSPLTNFRTDEFGGSLENRARFALMMLEEVRKAAGNDMLIEIQFSAEEIEGGYDAEEGIEFLKLAEKYVDIVQVRSPEGDPNHPIPFELEKMPFLEMAAKIKAAGLDFVVSNVGGYFDPALADKAIAEGKVDMVAMARAWISNPNYGELLYADKADEIIPCLRCNKCHGRGERDVLTTTCSVNPKFGLEAVDKYLCTEPTEVKTVGIIGGGPAGMRMAMYLADRGHKVTVYEKEAELGGAIRHSDYVDFKWTLKDYKDYLIRQLDKKGVNVKLNTCVTPEMIDGLYDVVVAAVGAQPIIPRIPGADGANVTVATDAIMNSEKIGKNVVVIGGGEVGVETGMFLANQGRNVTCIEMRDTLAADCTKIHYRSMFQEAWETTKGFSFILNATAKEITADHVTYTDKDGVDHEIPADSVVLSVGMRSKDEEALRFYGTAKQFFLVGDCKKPGTIQTTNRNVYAIAMNI